MIDTNRWQPFVIQDLFDIVLSKGDIKLDEVESGSVPLVSSGETNNGVVGYITDNGDGIAQLFPGNVLTVDMFCNAFYQNMPFYAVSHGRVNILKPKFRMTTAIGLFIASIIKREQYKYSYGRAVYSGIISKMEILLPTTTEGTPDWDYMERFVGRLSENLR